MSSNADYIKEIDAAFEMAIDIVNSDGWKKEKHDKETDTLVELKKNEEGRKIYRGKAKIKMAPKAMIEQLRNADKATDWNTTLQESKVLVQIDAKHQITYQERLYARLT